MIIQKRTLLKQYDLFKKHLPNVTPYFAIKANPEPDIIKT